MQRKKRCLFSYQFDEMEKILGVLEGYLTNLLGVSYVINYRVLLRGYFDDKARSPFRTHLRGMVLSLLKEASEHDAGKEHIIFKDNEVEVKNKPFPQELVDLFNK